MSKARPSHPLICSLMTHSFPKINFISYEFPKIIHKPSERITLRRHASFVSGGTKQRLRINNNK